MEQYGKYVEAMNELFGCALPKPTAVNPETSLYIFGFDRNQAQGELKKIEATLEREGVSVYSKGGEAKATPGNPTPDLGNPTPAGPTIASRACSRLRARSS